MGEKVILEHRDLLVWKVLKTLMHECAKLPLAIIVSGLLISSVIFIKFTIKIGSLALEGEPPLFFFVLALLKLVTTSTHVCLRWWMLFNEQRDCNWASSILHLHPLWLVQNLSYNNRRNLACIDQELRSIRSLNMEACSGSFSSIKSFMF